MFPAPALVNQLKSYKTWFLISKLFADKALLPQIGSCSP